MRRVHRPWPLLVLVALLGLLGPPATASASDAGLRALVTEQRAAEKRQEAAIERSATSTTRGITASTSLAQVRRRTARALQTIERHCRRFRRETDAFRARFEAEAPETNEATVGRTLVVRGLRDAATSFRRTERATNRAVARIRRSRTADGFVRISERFQRELERDAAAERSEKRLKRGRTLIRTAPAPAPAG